MIERVVVEGRPATAAYINSDFEPVGKDQATLVKIIFDDGEDVLFLKPVKKAEEKPAD